MTHKLQRRHSRWYELLIFNPLFIYLLGFACVVLLPNVLRWDTALLYWPMHEIQFNTFSANALAYTASFLLLFRLKRYPGTRSLPFILPTLVTTWLLVFSVFLFLREEKYARQVLVYSFLLANFWAFAGYFFNRRYSKAKLAIVPFGRALQLINSPQALITLLEKPSLKGRRYDALVADLYAEDLPDEWQKFLAQCTLARIPVLHTQQLLESLTGRVQIEHLSENVLGSLLPSNLYRAIKRLLDTAVAIVFAPLWVPLMLITGLAIKLESEGPMFFIQERVGQGNKDFKVYKLRSMRKDSEKDGAQFAKTNDMRVTRIGRFIRKTRIDEIPQFINVLKGEMSIIGPRPEQRAFVDKFEEEIPFYSYRHVVKPGITGWAQVVHGYAAEVEGMNTKLEYDFYYIKNFSLWLDILIIVKTIKTILTGFGAR